MNMKGKSGDLNGFLIGFLLQGELEFEDTMRIDGKFNGKIRSKNELIVGESAHRRRDPRRPHRHQRHGRRQDPRGPARRDPPQRKVYSDIDMPALVIEEARSSRATARWETGRGQRHESGREGLIWSAEATPPLSNSGSSPRKACE
jgi:hypothetical protein